MFEKYIFFSHNNANISLFMQSNCMTSEGLENSNQIVRTTFRGFFGGYFMELDSVNHMENKKKAFC